MPLAPGPIGGAGPAGPDMAANPYAPPPMASTYGTGFSGNVGPVQGGGYGRAGSGLAPGVGTPAAAPAPPTTPPPAPEFMTPAMQTYVGQFQASQQAQQQAMNAALVQSLTGLASRRDAAAKVAATLPGQYAKAAANETTNAASAAKDANAAFGINAGGNLSAGQAANTARTSADQKAGNAAQPLLQAGITADATKGTQTLSNEQFQNQSALAQQQQAFDLAMAQQAAQYSHSQQDQTAAYAHDADMARLQSSLGQQDYLAEHPGGALTPAQQLKQQEDYYTFQKNAAPASGAAGAAGFSQGDVDKIHASPEYQSASNVLAGLTDANNKPGNKNYVGPAKGQSVAAWLQQEYGSSPTYSTMLRLILAENPGAAKAYTAGQ